MMAFEDEIRYILSSSGESLWITDSAWRLAKTCFGVFFRRIRCRKRRKTETRGERVNDSGQNCLVGVVRGQ
jgi:hypothetical protein